MKKSEAQPVPETWASLQQHVHDILGNESERFEALPETDKIVLEPGHREYMNALRLLEAAVLLDLNMFSNDDSRIFADADISQIWQHIPVYGDLAPRATEWLWAANSLANLVSERTERLAEASPGSKVDDLHRNARALALDAHKKARQASREDDLDEMLGGFREVLGASRQAVAKTGESKLVEHFEKLRRAERRMGEVFRWLGISIITGVGVAAIVVFGGAEKLSTAEVLRHAATGLPFVLLAGYLAGQANQHLRNSRWAAITMVQLETFEAFTAPMEKPERESMRAYLGHNIFGEPAWSQEVGREGLSISTADLLELAKKAG